MRIAMVSEHASPLAAIGGVDSGGQNTHVAELAIALANRGHEVRVYTRRDDPDLPDVVPFVDGVLVEHVPAGPATFVPKDDLLPFMGEFGRWMATRWTAPDFTPDVVHAHFWMSGLAALTATSSSRIPVVVTYHALGSIKRRYQGSKDTSPDTRLGLERELGHLADRIIAQCSEEVEELGRMGIPRASIQIVPSGVNTDRFSPTGPRAERSPGGRPRILSVGRMVERKGFADLIQALYLVPEAELVLLGGPQPGELDREPMVTQLRRLAEKRGVADRVRIVGCVPKEDMADWYRSADVVACAPWYEPFGLTPLEAMACGVPVVAYAVGGLAESVIDGVTGVLVPPRDIRRLAAALRSVLGDEVRRMSYASAAVDRVRSRYTWERTAADIERVYASVTGEPIAAGGALTEVSS
ncbi:glycosyltransferase family 1 protein [Planosporangium thailandense]|uniref:Glycosyltransferase family 1 protein n=1 Tax=Planosporangium thailandense TaxID=765197 RepID=A0ABX0XY86_9ACTN|nr:glycosyltransferase [Planosporangium thailandense]NJC71012.1 glycosyltransferase family 1 protein [Planosporangium thailandense]